MPPPPPLLTRPPLWLCIAILYKYVVCLCMTMKPIIVSDNILCIAHNFHGNTKFINTLAVPIILAYIHFMLYLYVLIQKLTCAQHQILFLPPSQKVQTQRTQRTHPPNMQHQKYEPNIMIIVKRWGCKVKSILAGAKHTFISRPTHTPTHGQFIQIWNPHKMMRKKKWTIFSVQTIIPRKTRPGAYEMRAK